MKRLYLVAASILLLGLPAFAQFDMDEVVAEINGKLFYFRATRVDMEAYVEKSKPSFPQTATLIRHSYWAERWDEEMMDYVMYERYLDYDFSGTWVIPPLFEADYFCDFPYKEFWLTHIDKDVFKNCSNLKSITLPNSIDYLEDYTFAGAPNLTEIHCKWDKPKSVNHLFGDNEGQYETCTLYVPSGKEDVYKNSEGWNKFQVIKAEPVDCLSGDVDGNEVVDIDDMNVVINVMLHKAEATPAADVDADGTVDIDDMNAIINVMLHKE